MAAKLANLGVGRPGENAPIGANTQDEAARQLNVSRSAVQRARQVQERKSDAGKSAAPHRKKKDVGIVPPLSKGKALDQHAKDIGTNRSFLEEAAK